LLQEAESTAKVAARVAVNTSLGAASGALSAMIFNMFHNKKDNEYTLSLEATMNGALCGLVSITGACGTVELWAAVLIGAVGGWSFVLGNTLLIRWRIDDVVQGIPVHLFGGMWGTLATGFFSSPSAIKEAYGTDEYAGWFYELGRLTFDGTLLTNQMILLLSIIGWTCTLMVPFFYWLNYLNWLRTGQLEEVAGLDTQYMAENHEGKDEAVQDLNAFRKEVRRVRKPRQESERLNSTNHSTRSSIVSVESFAVDSFESCAGTQETIMEEPKETFTV